MNERINKLAREAMVERASGFREFDANVFAELIVHECAMLDFYKAGHTTVEGDHEISKMILRNFGMME